MFLTVTGCNHQDQGKKRVYSFDNRASALEFPEYPVKLRFKFYDASGRVILRGQTLTDMKAAVERHNKKWKIKS